MLLAMCPLEFAAGFSCHPLRLDRVRCHRGLVLLIVLYVHRLDSRPRMLIFTRHVFRTYFYLLRPETPLINSRSAY